MARHLSNQTEINDIVRCFIVDWIIEVAEKWNLKQYSIHLAINLFDKYLAVEDVDIDEVLLVSTVCLYIASKYEEINCVPVDEIREQCEQIYTDNQIFEMEYTILNKLDYQMTFDTPYYHLLAIQAKKKISDDDFHFASFLCLCVYLETDYLSFTSYGLADKIIDFILLLHHELKQIEDTIHDDVAFGLFFLVWEQIGSSDFFIVNSKYSKSSNRLKPNITYQKTIADVRSKLSIAKIADIPSNRYHHKYTQTDIKLVHYLGSGAYGNVYKAKITDQFIALKIAKIENNHEGVPYHMLREINALMTIEHKNIVRMYAFWYTPDTSTMYISLELMHQTLLQRIELSPIPENQKKDYIIQFLNGLQYMHSLNMMHRDLTPKNILLSADGKLKIADLGLARGYSPHDTVCYTQLICAINYRPIEVLLENFPYDISVDIWSSACVISLILNGSVLFPGNADKEILCSIFRQLGTPTESFEKDLLQWPGFKKNYPYPIFRPEPSITDIGKTYPVEAIVLRRMLSYCHAKRTTAMEVLAEFQKIYNEKN